MISPVTGNNRLYVSLVDRKAIFYELLTTADAAAFIIIVHNRVSNIYVLFLLFLLDLDSVAMILYKKVY